ncbi:MAG: DnaB-like helicase C-terminal domain-containing protein [Thermoguttaceae bacterium]
MSTATSEILDQRPPADPEAERWVVGSAILRPSVLDDLTFLQPSDFYDETLATVFGWLRDRHQRGEPIDVGLLGQHFKGDDWTARLAEIIQAVPVAHHAAYYGRIVATVAKWRCLRNVGEDLIQQAQMAEGEPETLLDAVESKLSTLTLTAGDGEPVTSADAAVQAITHIDAIQQRGQSDGVPTGLFSFDNDQGGLFPGELTILAARPGVGKTSLALQVASHNAERGRLVYFASLEMSAVELSIRLACGESGVSNRSVRIGQFRDGETDRLADALRRQSSMALEIHDRAALTVAAIRREIRKRKKRGLALAVVDYLQLVTPEDRRLPREQQVARMVRSLKETAREYQIPILCLCQLNRQADGDDIPRLSQLRESGAIEQDADVVLFLSKHEPTKAEQHNAILTVAKNRNGETGPIRMNWDGPTTRFSCPEEIAPHKEFAEFSQLSEG